MVKKLRTASHRIGFVASLAGTPFLIMPALKDGDASIVVTMALFPASMIMLYLASTQYHALPSGRAKQIFRVIEYSAIYLLIATTG
jgi:hemolysin III